MCDFRIVFQFMKIIDSIFCKYLNLKGFEKIGTLNEDKLVIELVLIYLHTKFFLLVN